jgi:monothiol glutaredoxin
MQRSLLPQAQVHSAIRTKIASYHQEVVAEVKRAVATHDVVVVGMRLNPFPGKARRLLDSHGIAYEYLGWGSYLSEWKPRLAIKLWSGWPTFPQIFVKGVLVGGYSDLKKLLSSGEFTQLLAAHRVAE